jgi:REP element-mobilizing transposase RayT
MPNHVHGIIIIDDIVETGYIPSLCELKKYSLGNIIGKFKAANFQWQSRFYYRPKAVILNPSSPTENMV